jgi:hypothetical protein
MAGVTAMHVSDSSEQRAAEAVMLAIAGEQLGMALAPRRVHLPRGSYVDVDGVADSPLTFVEAFARQGVAKGGQVHKLKGDTLKLVMLRQSHPDARLVLLVGSEQAAAKVRTGWLGEAVSTFGIEVLVVDVGDELRTALLAAPAAAGDGQSRDLKPDRTVLSQIWRSDCVVGLPRWQRERATAVLVSHRAQRPPLQRLSERRHGSTGRRRWSGPTGPRGEGLPLGGHRRSCRALQESPGQ